MQRRSFVTGLAVWGLVSAAGVGAGARPRGLIESGERRPVMVNENGRGTLISRLVVSDGVQALGLGWGHGAEMFYEDRVNLSGAGGVLAQVFRTPFRVRWQRASPAGTVELVPGANLLVARVQDAGRFAGAAATLGAGDYSWDLPGRFAPAAAVPQGRAAGAIRIGEDGRVLILLPQMVAQG